MTFTTLLLSQAEELFPTVLVWTLVPLIPFIIAEQLRSLGPRPAGGITT